MVKMPDDRQASDERRFVMASFVILLVLLLVAPRDVPSRGVPQDKGAARQQLARMGIRYNVRAFMKSAQYNRRDQVVLFLDAGIDPNSRDGVGNTALINASSFGNAEIVKVLIARGAKIDSRGPLGDTALIMAANFCRTESVKLLLAAGADVNATAGAGRTALGEAAGFEPRWNQRLPEAQYPDGAIMPSPLADCTETMRLLLDAGARPNSKDVYGYSALMMAAYRGNTDGVTLLLDRGADLKSDGTFALTCAIAKHHTDTVKVLLGRGAILDSQDKQARSALRQASRKGWTDILELLKEHGVTTLN
jgi:ankyrin repeat protein